MRPVVLVPMVVGLASAAACGTFDPQPDPTRFYLMTASSGAGTADRVLEGLSLGLGPVDFAPYLDQQKIVTRVEAHRVEFGTYERWAEPFGDHFVRILGEELLAQTAIEDVHVYPWLVPEDVDVVVEASVRRFDRTPDGGAELDVAWVIRGGMRPTGAILSQDAAVLREDAAGTGPNGSVRFDDSVEAMSGLMSRLAGRLAQDLIRVRPQLGSGSPH